MTSEPDLRSLETQQELVQAWVQSSDARRVAKSLLVRHRLSLSADDLINEAWLKITKAFERRDTSYPDLDTSDAAARFGTRVLDNLARDQARRTRRRSEIELVESFAIEDPELVRVEHRHLLEILLVAVSQRARHLDRCPGCPSEVVVAVALEVVHLVLAGSDGAEQGRTWMDRLLFQALDRIEGGHEKSTVARNQRKSRCGRCASELLQRSLVDVMEPQP